MRLVTFDHLPDGVFDQPAVARCIGVPPGRLTQAVYASASGVEAGVWSCAPGQWKIRFHGGRHEFFYVLAGQLAITDSAGLRRVFGPGEACVIPAGFAGLFEVIVPVRKYYVMIDQPDVAA